MSPILKKIPALTIGALSLCFIAAACGHGTEQRAASGGVGGAVAGAVVGGPVGAVVGAAAGGAGGAAVSQQNAEGR
jgi:hypothetical protein